MLSVVRLLIWLVCIWVELRRVSVLGSRIRAGWFIGRRGFLARIWPRLATMTVSVIATLLILMTGTEDSTYNATQQSTTSTW